MTRKTKSVLSGKMFHSFNPADKELEWQGQILHDLEDGYYLVLLYDWLIGAPSSQKIVHLSEMKGWNLYDDADYWKDEGERRSRYESRGDDSSDPKASEVLPSM